MSAQVTSRPGHRDAHPSLSRGTTQSGVRAYNERLVLSLVRFHGHLPKAEVARLTGLSAQTVSVIIRQLESDGMLGRLKPQRGKVGQPLVPFALNPEGAFAIGLKVGRRSGDLMLLDLTGKVRRTLHRPYRFPSPEEILAFAHTGVDEITAGLAPEQRRRICGIGIAAPFELWAWEEDVDAPRDVLMAWRGFDLAREIARVTEWPVHFCNDATAACAAELLFGKGQDLANFAYFYLGYFIGGGVVMNGSLYQGRSGNAGALGSFPVPDFQGGSNQLIRRGSLHVLEREIQNLGGNPEELWRTPGNWSAAQPALERWLKPAARDIAIAAAGAASVLDSSAIVIDGAMPGSVRTRLADEVRLALSQIDLRGISPFSIVEGTIGFDARAMGAASLPLFENFIINRNVLFKESD